MFTCYTPRHDNTNFLRILGTNFNILYTHDMYTRAYDNLCYFYSYIKISEDELTVMYDRHVAIQNEIVIVWGRGCIKITLKICWISNGIGIDIMLTQKKNYRQSHKMDYMLFVNVSAEYRNLVLLWTIFVLGFIIDR